MQADIENGKMGEKVETICICDKTKERRHEKILQQKYRVDFLCK